MKVANIVKTKQRKDGFQVSNRGTSISCANKGIVSMRYFNYTYIGNAQGIRFALLSFLSPHASIAGALPPFVVQYLDLSLLLKLQNGQGYLVAPR